jgi:hypothetical protein
MTRGLRERDFSTWNQRCLPTYQDDIDVEGLSALQNSLNIYAPRLWKTGLCVCAGFKKTGVCVSRKEPCLETEGPLPTKEPRLECMGGVGAAEQELEILVQNGVCCRPYGAVSSLSEFYLLCMPL